MVQKNMFFQMGIQMVQIYRHEKTVSISKCVFFFFSSLSHARSLTLSYEMEGTEEAA